MDIAIIGGGSIGLLISSYVAARHDVTLYVKRRTQQQALEKQHIQVYKHSSFAHKVKVKSKVMEKISENHQLYIVCVKQNHVSDVLHNLSSVTAPILFLQNGMGHIDKVRILSQNIYLGVVSHGANRTADYKVNFLGAGQINLASLTGNLHELKQLTATLHSSTFPFKYVRNWDTLLKEKLIVNAVINPLTALFDVPNGEIITNQHITKLAKKICEETAYVLEMSKTLSWSKVVETAQATSDNMSSMRSDLRNNQQTELEAISGYILRKSNRDLPYTTFIYYAILALNEEGV